MSTFTLVATIVLAHFSDGTVAVTHQIVATGLTQAECQRESIYPPTSLRNATWSCEIEQRPAQR